MNKKVGMSVNLVIERVIKDKRRVVEEREGISLDYAYRNLWKTGFSNGAFVLDMNSSYLKTTRKMYKEPGCLETATYTGFAGKDTDLAILNTVAFMHRYIQSKRIGVIRLEDTPIHLVDVVEVANKRYDPNINNENMVLNAFLHAEGLECMTGMSRADRETAVMMLHVGGKTEQDIKVHFGFALSPLPAKYRR